MRCVALFSRWCVPVVLAMGVLALLDASTCEAQLIPGTGRPLRDGGDNFEDPAWKYHLNWPKGSEENDGETREPEGESANGLWFEGPKRGQPDWVKRVPTPAGGIPGSTSSLLMKTLYSGVPNWRSHRMQQDDLIFNLPIDADVSRAPNVIVRVCMPPFEKWENRTGPTFAFRTSVEPRYGRSRRVRGPNGWEIQPPTYWPGIFVDFESKDNGAEYDHAFLRVRANDQGHEYNAVKITKPGWWTMGMSFTPDGRVHYYASPGVDKLTEKDRLGSEVPYSERAGVMTTFFFDVCNHDDGKTWSTSWIIDDPQVYLAR
ncbi:MAG: hypothetical protein MI757_10460 [Pirellulales bacterium]|nr:hypothetical protein [Pirellulales bacterium]